MEINTPFKKFLAFIFISFIIYSLLHDHKERKESFNWPSVKGKINKAYVKQIVEENNNSNNTFSSRSMHYEISVEYFYIIDSVNYIGHRVRVNSERYYSESTASSELKKYREGSAVTVYYNPKLPKDSVLNPG